MGELVTVLNAAGGAFVAFAAQMLIQSSVLIVLLAVLDFVLRRRVKAVVRYWIWLLVLAKLLLPPSFSSPTGVAYWVGGKLPTLSGPIEPLADESSTLSLPADGTAVFSEPRGLDACPSVRDASEELPAARADNTVLQATPHAPLLTWQALVLLGWAVVVIVMAVLLGQRALFVHRLVAQSRAPGPEIVELLGQCARRMGVRTDLTVKLSPLSASPSVCGLRRPVILVPEEMLARLSVPELRAVLLHELAHIKRGDLWLNLLQAVLQVVYFYHPLLWVANVRIRMVREQAVDETVLAALGEEAEDYPRTLLSVSRAAFGQPTLSLRLLGVVESEKALMDRIRHMVSRPFPKNARPGLLGLAAVAVIAAVLLPMARGAPGRPSGASSLMDRLQREEDPELAELIRTAVANHQGAGEKEILEITRRVTEGHAQILLLDAQIAQVTHEIEATPASAETRGKLLLAKKEFEAKRMTEMGNLREIVGIVPKVPFDKQPTGDLNTWLNLQVLDQRVVVYDGLKPFQDYWAMWRENVAAVLSEQETLDYIRGRLKDRKNLPMRVTINYRAETRGAGERLRDAVLTVARETHTDMDVEVRLELIWWANSNMEAPFFCREGRIRTLYAASMARPDGSPNFLRTGLVDPNDLEQHVLWRLSYPGNVPLRLRIEYDQASAPMARQVAETVKTTAQRLGVADLVEVAQALVESVPETAFLGRWEALGKGYLQALEIQPQGACRVIVGEGSGAFRAGASVTGTWMPTCKEILVDIKDQASSGAPCYYLVSINQNGNLVVDRTEIYTQGYFYLANTGQMIFQKVK
jgi:beta-lactamase regulating signal transducer with metallopeptidase domain